MILIPRRWYSQATFGLDIVHDGRLPQQPVVEVGAGEQVGGGEQGAEQRPVDVAACDREVGIGCADRLGELVGGVVVGDDPRSRVVRQHHRVDAMVRGPYGPIRAAAESHVGVDAPTEGGLKDGVSFGWAVRHEDVRGRGTSLACW
jgi:hypothetical protein